MGGVGSGNATGTTAVASKGGGDYGSGSSGGSRGGGKRGPIGKGKGISKEFTADNPQQMPVYNSPAQLEAARRKRMEIMARSGRTSTNLTGNPGTQTYRNTFLGNV